MFNILTPLMAFSPVLMVMSRLLLGVVQVGFFPASYVLVSKWFPLAERSFAFGTMLNGAAVGDIASNALSGWLAESHGWPAVFYVSGIVAIVTFLIFLPTVTSTPDTHKFVSKKELAKIQESTSIEESSTKSNRPVPWLTILKSRHVWGVLMYKGLNSQLSLIAAKLPTYMSQIMRVNTAKV